MKKARRNYIYQVILVILILLALSQNFQTFDLKSSFSVSSVWNSCGMFSCLSLLDFINRNSM